MKAFSIFFLVSISLAGFSQTEPYNWSDSGRLDGKYSYLDVNAGLGNNTFTPRKQNPKGGAYNQLYYFVGAGYYHLSGASISFQSFATNDQNALSLYQTLITAAYDFEKYNYVKKSGVGFGVNYTRLLNKDSVSFYQSPLKNQYSAYFKWMNPFVTPTIAFTYGSGKTSVVKFLPLPPRRVDVKAREYNLNLNLSHTFYLGSTIDDYRKIEPSIDVFAGKNEYGGLNPRQRKAAARVSDNSFQVQDIIFNVEATYNIGGGDFYIMPSLMLDYYYPKADSKWYPMFSLTLGYVFW